MRLIRYKRLNMYYKHRVSMLYSMASNLIIHERIRTTLGKARSLVFLMNNLFKKIAPMDSHAEKKAKTIVRIPLAYKKLFNGLVEKYRNNMGGVVRIVKDPKVRLNDNSQMAYVEFLDNKANHEQDIFLNILKEKNNGLGFLEWELFVRERELASYKLEKERRINLYTKLQKVISECQTASSQSKEKLEYLIQEKLFGDTNLKNLISDYRIPPQHIIQFYLKAKNPHELDSFFKDSEFYLSKLIRRTNYQIEYLYNLKADAKRAQKYEKRNYLRFIGMEKIKEAQTIYKDKEKFEQIENHFTRDIILKKMELLNSQNKKEIESEVRILKTIDDHIKKNKYNKFNLTPQQKDELNRIRRIEILKNKIFEETKSADEQIRLYKNNKKDYKINYYKNNKNTDIDKFDLKYNQRMLTIFDKENISSDYSTENLKFISKEVQKLDSENRIAKGIIKRQDVENSLRKKKRYHLPENKKVQISLDKYSDENEYYLVRSFREKGLDINRNKKEKF